MSYRDAVPAPVILTAEDEAGHRAVMEMLLSLDGYEIVSVGDGREALAWLKEHTPALAILDVRMPHLGGLEVCRRMKAVKRLARVPVVILTALRDEATTHAAEAVGADLLVHKPLEGKDLRAQVRALLGSG